MQEMLHSAAELTEYIDKVGMLPLLRIAPQPGWSADEAVDEDCRYVAFPDGGWEWKLWEWKGDIIRDGEYAYGKFFLGKAAFISREWWPDLCNYRRSIRPAPAAGSIEEAIIETLKMNGSMTTRELRHSCGFTAPGMRGKFDGFVSKLQMSCRIVTEDFVYPQDKHGKPYGWGWSLLTIPESLFGKSACHPDRTPEESRQRLLAHLREILPDASEHFLNKLLDKNS